MASFNQCTFMGNITRDPEQRAAGDSSVCAFGIAVNEKRGERETTMFLDCEAWGKTGDVIAQYMKKGSPILVSGSLKLDTWQDKDGGNRSKHKLTVFQFSFVGSRDEAGSGPPPAKSSVMTLRGISHRPMEDDDIPF